MNSTLDTKMDNTLNWILGVGGAILLFAILFTAGVAVHKIRGNTRNIGGNLKSFTSTESQNTGMKVLDSTSGSNLDISSQGSHLNRPGKVGSTVEIARSRENTPAIFFPKMGTLAGKPPLNAGKLNEAVFKTPFDPSRYLMNVD